MEFRADRASTGCLHESNPAGPGKTRLAERVDQILTGFCELSSRQAFEALEAVFGEMRESGCPGQDDLTRFFGLVTLVLLRHARGGVVRFSGRDHSRACEARLRFGDVYEAALDRTMDFLARNFPRHLKEYSPRGYRMAMLRWFAKQYSILLAVRAGSEQIEPEPVGERFIAAGAGIDRDAPGNGDALVFHDWYYGNLSRHELSGLHRLAIEEIEQALLRHAARFEHGRVSEMVRTLVRLGDDGDIWLLASKGLSAEQIAEKVGRTRHVVHKHLQALRRRFGRLREMGEPGRKFAAWFCGTRPELAEDEDVCRLRREYGPDLGIAEPAVGPPADA